MWCFVNYRNLFAFAGISSVVVFGAAGIFRHLQASTVLCFSWLQASIGFCRHHKTMVLARAGILLSLIHI